MAKSFDVVQCREGWSKLYQPIIDEVINHDISQVNNNKRIGIESIYEEDGELRIDLIQEENAYSSLFSKIRDAELASVKTCEYCGATENVGTTMNFHFETCCKSCWESHILPKRPQSVWKDYDTQKSYSITQNLK